MKGLRLLGLVCMTLVLVAGCGEDKVTTPTPTPTPTPTGTLPVVKAGSWDVSYNRNGTTGDPPVDLGDHARR